MNLTSKFFGFTGLILAVLCCTSVLLLPGKANAKTVAIEGMSYNTNASISDNLKMLIHKKVTVNLNSGDSYTGTVKVVGTQLVHLEMLEGNEYFDALVRLKDICGIRSQFRKFQQ